MAISLASLRRGSTPQPPRLLVYGVAGVGKTSLAANAPTRTVTELVKAMATLTARLSFLPPAAVPAPASTSPATTGVIALGSAIGGGMAAKLVAWLGLG